MRWHSRGRRPWVRTRRQDEDAPPGPARSAWLELQRLVGNRFMQRLLARGDPSTRAPAVDDGSALGPSERAELEPALGENLADVRLHDDSETRRAAGRLGAAAFSAGRDIYLGGGVATESQADGSRRRVIAHEAIHVLQRRRAGASSTSRPLTEPHEASEREAASGSAQAMAGQRVAVSAAPSGVIARQPAPPTAKGSTSAWPGLEPPYVPPPTHVFEDPAGGTPAGARRILDQYAKLDPPVRRMAFDYSYPRGSVTKVLKALPAADAAAAYRDTLIEILRWVEEAETRTASGTSDDQMAQTEATWEQARQQAAAQKALGRKPTPAEVDQQRQGVQEHHSFHHPAVKTRWEKLTKIKQAEWTVAADQAISAIVAYAGTAHPELKLIAADFKHAFHEIDKNSPGALAQAGQAGGRRVVEIGFEFVDAVKVKPAYALSTAVHELRGHAEFDSPGDRTWQLGLYRKAAAKMPGYASSEKSELASFGYHESEIYSLLRELPYWTPVADTDKKVAHLNPDPKSLVVGQIEEIASEWEPTLLVALLRGFLKRLSVDPRIEASALAAFKNAIKAALSAADAAQVLK